MSVLSGLYSTLNTNAGVRALIGITSSPQQSRVYPNNAPEDAALPHITYLTITRVPIDSLKGTNNLQQHTVQISCHASTFAGAQALADAVFAALEGDGYQEGRFDFYDSETKAHSVNLEWLFTA